MGITFANEVSFLKNFSVFSRFARSRYSRMNGNARIRRSLGRGWGEAMAMQRRVGERETDSMQPNDSRKKKARKANSWTLQISVWGLDTNQQNFSSSLLVCVFVICCFGVWEQQ